LKAIDFIFKPYSLTGILVVIILAISLQRYFLPLKTFVPDGVQYTQYNNYVIFKQSFHHLSHGKDLYSLYPGEHWDLYKYSPAFALLMAPLAFLPDLAGLTIWNLLNTLVLFFALSKLPFRNRNVFLGMMGFLLIEMLTATQNSQSNCLIAGFILLAFVLMEDNKPALASLLIVSTVFIKIFGIVALLIFLLYPQKLKSALWTALWTLLFLILPLLVISPVQLLEQYQSWFRLLVNDRSAWEGLSLAGVLDKWFDLEFRNGSILTGAVLFLAPLIRVSEFRNYNFRLLFMASTLIWMVIFNFRAESATFVIAVAGVAIWYFFQDRNWVNTSLLILVLIFTVLSPTDLFPRQLRKELVIPYALKAVPCILVWIKIQVDLLTFRFQADS
jgi:hypothetical protein